MVIFEVNTDELKNHVGRLREMYRSALPVAIRGTLNKAAFHTKKDTLLKSAKQSFVERDKNFFRATSSVDKAKGFNIEGMRATVGFTSSKLKGSNNFAIKDLEQQEEGGDISGRSFVPLAGARTGKNYKKKVKQALRITKIKNIVNANKVKSSKKTRQKFIRAAIKSKMLYGNEAYVLGTFRKGKATLSRIEQVSSDVKTKKLVIKQTPVYVYEKGFKASVKGTSFAKRAAMQTASKMNDFFKSEAERQFQRLNK